MTIFDLDKNTPYIAGCMATVSGKIIDLFDPKPDDFDLEDIAHGLAFNSRWNGHTKTASPYTIAEHSLRVFDAAPSHLKLAALFHDAEEAYWGDMIRPLKIFFKENCPQILEAMLLTRRAIFEKFGIEWTAEYKEYDESEMLWDFENMILDQKHLPMSANLAKQTWLAAATELTKDKKSVRAQ